MATVESHTADFGAAPVGEVVEVCRLPDDRQLRMDLASQRETWTAERQEYRHDC